jgi:hypothetical protein
MKQIIKIALVLAVVANGCAVLKKGKKVIDCPDSGASALDLTITGFVPVDLRFAWAEQNTFQIQLTDTIGTEKKLGNHTSLCFSKEKPEVEKLEKVMPAAALCCIWDNKKKFFTQSSTENGVPQSVLWAYGQQANIPSKYLKHLEQKKQNLDDRRLAYAVYRRHVIWPVTLKKGKETINTFQCLLQEKNDDGTVSSLLVTIIGMDSKSLESILYNNTAGVVFEISEKEFNTKTGTWVDPGQGDGQVFTLAWNAEKAESIVTEPVFLNKKQEEKNNSFNSGSNISSKKSTNSGGLRR